MSRRNGIGCGLAVLVAVFLLSPNARAFVFGGSNLGVLGYPDHSCYAPYSKPYRPYSFNSQFEIDRYNDDVDRYNREVREFIDCIRDYVDNASNDIERIKEKANAAIDEANSL